MIGQKQTFDNINGQRANKNKSAEEYAIAYIYNACFYMSVINIYSPLRYSASCKSESFPALVNGE